MNRKYTIEEYLDIARYIRGTIPQAAVSTDFIVGFPGETEGDFKMTLDAVERVEFDQAFTFKYSPRPGTGAEKKEDSVPADIKKRRLSDLNLLCDEAALKRNRLMVGNCEEVFAQDLNSGRTDNYKIVFWEGPSADPGDIFKVRITDALNHSLKGVRAD